MSVNENKIVTLDSILKTFDKVIVAYSGGVDSCYLLYKCVQILGKANCVAITGVSDTYTKDEYDFSKDFSLSLGVEHLFINTNEFDNNDFISNSKERCFYCKKELYAAIDRTAKEKGISVICDGTNASDKTDYRPGKRAAKEFNVISPLSDAGFSKEDIRIELKDAGFSFFNKPANPCLASRVPYGEPITHKKLLQIEQGEKFLRKLGFQVIRLRNHGALARIEAADQEMPLFYDKTIRNQISSYFKELGFTWVSMDIDGYRTGSLNETFLK